MSDEEFARAFERGDVPPSAFSHQCHVRLAWVYLHESPTFDAALARVREGIQRFAAAAGASNKYHETITVLWMQLLDAARSRVMQPCTFADLLEQCPELADKDLPLKYYARERLFSDEARVRWIPPEESQPG
ncbi:MAG TPA: hypothetical protein VEL51_05160 [Vicinamibacterales bacterium]|nr:hypothetical protein [Vicinamibacterales bacterium]